MFIKIWALTIINILGNHSAYSVPLESLLKEDQLYKTAYSLSSNSEPKTAQSLNNDKPNKEVYFKERIKMPKSFIEIAKESGLKANKYEVITEDGYILTVFHIKGNGTKPVLLMHGFLDSADGFILRRNTSLVKVLAEAGYDTYVGNVRGNKYARKHISKNPDVDKDYWDFSFHEMGIYDLPSIIDFILNKHKVPSLTVVGFSQGTQIIWVMASERPEYNNKLKLAIAMAPVCFLQNVSGSMVQYLINTAPMLAFMYNVLDLPELISDKGLLRNFTQLLCTSERGYKLCTDNNILNLIQGNVTEEFEPEFLVNDFLPQFPTSTSVKNALHLVQLNKRKKFAYYDYGFIMNLLTYKSMNPPEYNLSRVTMEVVILQGANDILSNKEEIDMLSSRLPNIKQTTLVNCSHMDFMWGRHANEYVYNLILQSLK